MKLLFENWRKYLLNEMISLEQAKENLDRQGTLKIVKNYKYENPEAKIDQDGYPSSEDLRDHYKRWLLSIVEKRTDLTDDQKGLAVTWLNKLGRHGATGFAREVMNDFNVPGADLAHKRALGNSFEKFFHNKDFMPQKDLMKIKSVSEFKLMVHKVGDAIDQHRRSKLKSPEMIIEGTTFLRGDWVPNALTVPLSHEKLETVGHDGWVIMEIHNKAASCFHGTADWCTAAPGLDYFENYYKEDDPLFIFQNKSNLNKFQFHYGTSQFMDSKDNRVNDESFKVLHNMLKQTEAYNKYERLRIFDLERMVKRAPRDIDGSQAQAQIGEMREILNSLKDPYGMANSLADLATYQHFDIPTYILRWLASEEFYKYTGVALRIVRYHQIVPSDILQDIADNNPKRRTRDTAEAVLRMRKAPSHPRSERELNETTI